MRLFDYVEELEDKGKLTYEFQKIRNREERKQYDRQTGNGIESIFEVRENFSDFMFINTFIDQDFVDRYKLFVTGRRLNSQKGVWEYYVESRDARRYKKMILDSLYHPPHIKIDTSKSDNGSLYLVHVFEEKPLVKEFISNTMLGIEYLWGGPVKLETTEWVADAERPAQIQYFLYPQAQADSQKPKKEPQCRRVVYTMENRKLRRDVL
jgi:stage V sporulation protein R